MSKIILYNADYSPPCQAVRLVARALGLKLQLHDIDLLDKRDQLSEDFLKINPAHTLPTIDDNGLQLWESRAIMSYLVSQYGKNDKLYPIDPKKRALVDIMLNFELGSLYPAYYTSFRLLLAKKPVSDEAKAEVDDKLSTLNNILSSRAYVAGDNLTIADISILCNLYILLAGQHNMSQFSNITAWMEKVKKELSFYDEVTSSGWKKFHEIVKQMLG
ncbi:Glutathione S-transferase [Chamberlinius hualienensis]